MSDLKLISPMLDNFLIGDAIHSREGLKTYPAMRQDTEEKYILKVISVPSSASKLDALLLTGAYADKASALAYFRELTEDISQEAAILKQLSELEGFSAFEDSQMVEKEDGSGYDIYLLSPYQRSLQRQFTITPLTNLAAVNLGLDLCAALTVARRAGYLFVDLRPDNIYITPENHYKIGDIGFIRLNSLKYANLPDRYRSTYTAPESKDDYAAPSDTMDIYALGLVLYQVYNNTMLPTMPDENGNLAAPLYADNEMSEIILKACAADPAQRWQSPVELGQAIVSYMQRNGINDDPIVPLSAAQETSVDESVVETPTPDVVVISIEETIIEECATYAEDDFGNLSFLDDIFFTDNSECEDTLDIDISGEVADILEQADDLAAHSVPTPAVATDAVEVTMPEPEAPQIPDETIVVPIPDIDDYAAETAEEDAEEAEEAIEEETEEVPAPAAKKRKWLRNSIIILFILALLSCGAYFFLRYYFVPVNDMQTEGRKDKLIVYVDAEIDESLLSVECSYPEGTPMTADVKDGKAVFEGLTHDTEYSIRVRVQGFHKLTGKTTEKYATPELTSLLHFRAATGITDGSIVLDFPVTGPESEKWIITYWTTGEPAKTTETTGHTATINDLTIGKLYYFEVAPSDDLYTDGEWVITAIAKELVFAQDIVVNSFSDNKLVASWAAPDGVNIESWTVYCKGENFNKTTIVTEPTVTIDGIDTSKNYSLEIVADGMTKAAPAVEVSANAINIKNISAQIQQGRSILLSWESDQTLPSGSWITYTIDGAEASARLYISGHSVVIPDYVSGAKYVFTFHNSGNTGFVGVPFIYYGES